MDEAWAGWRFEGDRLISPTGRSYTPEDIEPARVGRNELVDIIGCASRQALTDRIKRGTVPQPDGYDGRNPWWWRKNIAHLAD